MKNHQITEEEVEKYLDQPLRELIASQAGGGTRKDIYAVVLLKAHTTHYLVNGARFDTLREAVSAYNAAQGVRS